jgi:hypothetical protein
MGSAHDYEVAQERIMSIFKDWQMPPSMTIHQFVARVGDYGGYMVVETNEPADLHFCACVFTAMEFKVEPVLDIGDALVAETRALEYRKANAA